MAILLTAAPQPAGWTAAPQGDSGGGTAPVTITLPLLASAAQLFAPTVAPAPHPVLLPLLAGGAVLFAPSVVEGSAGAQVIVLPLLAGVGELYAPAIVPVVRGYLTGRVRIAPALTGYITLTPA